MNALVMAGRGGGAGESGGADEADKPLPGLREELQLTTAGHDAGLKDGHMIFDPVRHCYFRIPSLAAAILSQWHRKTPSLIVEALGQRGIGVTADDVAELATFVDRNGLTLNNSNGTPGLAAQRKSQQKSAFSSLLHNYLFFRVPLVRPHDFLSATLPWVGWLGSRSMRMFFIGCAVLGFYLAGLQWDAFANTFLHFLSLEGLMLYGVTLVGVKIVHELGHAYVATRYGCRVPHMGVAFMVLFPMLYTEVSDAWKLTSRKQKLAIDLAGVASELALASLALVAWSFLPEGPARSAAFFVATTGWILSLAVNLSPFMRFDGYHVLADALAIHNLQPRAFALGRTSLRNKLFGLNDPPPEVFRPWLHKLLVAYSWGTWVYRFFLFLGIALLIYHISFKVLGIALAVVEVMFFLIKPIWGEVMVWIKMRDRIRNEGNLWPRALVLCCLILMLFVPFDARVHVPAVMGAGAEEQHFAPEPAQIVDIRVSAHDRVNAGDILMVLSVPELDYREALAKLRLELTQQRLQRIAGDDQDRAQGAVLERERAMLVREIEGFAARRAKLEVRAQTAGLVTQVLPNLATGVWVNPKSRLVHIAGEITPTARGVVAEQDVSRLDPGAPGTFIADDASLGKVEVSLAFVGAGTSAARELKLLSSTYGGTVDASPDANGNLRTTSAMFPVHFASAGEPDILKQWPREVRGVVVATGKRRSIATRIATRVVSVLLRETGF